MAEKTVEKQICQKCGAEVRPNTLFCYNCGGSVTDPSKTLPTVKDKLLEEELSAAIKADKNSAVSKETKLTSAASLRERRENPSKKMVEVVWEEPDSAPNPWFLAVAFLLTLFAVGILAAMLCLR